MIREREREKEEERKWKGMTKGGEQEGVEKKKTEKSK